MKSEGSAKGENSNITGKANVSGSGSGVDGSSSIVSSASGKGSSSAASSSNIEIQGPNGRQSCLSLKNSSKAWINEL